MQVFKDIWSPRSLVVIFLIFKEGNATISALNYAVNKEGNHAQLFDTLEEVLGHFGKSAAYHLHVSGSGVLSRKMESLPNYQDDLVINGNPDDFIFSTYDDGQSIAASFFRKALISVHIESLLTQKIHLLGISAGPSILFTLDDDLRCTFDYQLIKVQGKITEFKRSEQPQEKMMVDGLFLTSDQVLAKAIFKTLRTPDEHYPSSWEANDAVVNYAQFKQFKTYGLSLLTVIFCALVINYFYQNHLNDEVAQLELDLSISNENLALLDRLDQEKIRKEQLVFSAGIHSPKFLSFYLDEIGMSVPASINLQELEVFPLDGKLKNKHKVEVNQQHIRISGTTPGNEIMDDWIELLDRFEWVKGIELMNYSKQEGTGADFSLLITLNI